MESGYEWGKGKRCGPSRPSGLGSGRVFGQGEFKNTTKTALTKSPCRKLFQKKRQKLRSPMSVFPRFFVFHRASSFRVFSSDESSKAATKNVLQKNRVEKYLQKNPKPTFFRFCFHRVFGRFSVRGVQKHDKIY
jgi:hypothetical protein